MAEERLLWARAGGGGCNVMEESCRGGEEDMR